MKKFLVRLLTIIWEVLILTVLVLYVYAFVMVIEKSVQWTLKEFIVAPIGFLAGCGCLVSNTKEILSWFKFDKKEKYKNDFIKLWTYLSENVSTKDEAIEVLGLPAYHCDCPCCELYRKNGCNGCPMKLEDSEGPRIYCTEEHHPYQKWWVSISSAKNKTDLLKYAKQVLELGEKEWS